MNEQEDWTSSILQSADDTHLFGQNSREEAMHIKWLFYCYESWSVLRINFHKSSVMQLNLSLLPPLLPRWVARKNPSPEVSRLPPMPRKNLRSKIRFRSLRKSRRGLLAGRASIYPWELESLFINSILFVVPIYLMSFFEIPKWVSFESTASGGIFYGRVMR